MGLLFVWFMSFFEPSIPSASDYITSTEQKLVNNTTSTISHPQKIALDHGV